MPPYAPEQETVIETPLKRRKLDFEHSRSSPGGQSFDSQDFTADDLFAGGQEPVSLLPTQNTPFSHPTYDHVTQPTQIIPDRIPLATPERARVQVPASSPARLPRQTPPRPVTNINLDAISPQKNVNSTFAASMAPLGTSFRPPQSVFLRQNQGQPRESQSSRNSGSQVRSQKNIVIDLDDDDEGMAYKGGYSDDESQNNRDIKPSVVKSRKERPLPVGNGAAAQQNHASSRFNLNMAEFTYQGTSRLNNINLSSPSNSTKRRSDLLTSAYGGRDRAPKQQRQARPAQKQPEYDMALEDVPDFTMRQKIEFIQVILPTKTILQIRDALMIKKANQDDAIDYLTQSDLQPEEIDLTKSDGDGKPQLSKAQPARLTTKQQLKQPAKTINQKYGLSSQAPRRPSNAAPIISPIRIISDEKGSPTVPVKAPGPRRRLIKGRKHRPSSPIEVESDSDSGVDAKGESEDQEALGNLLSFFNTCPAADIIDMANIDKGLADHIVSCRPFKSLNDVRAIKESDYKTNSKVRKQKRPVGERVVDVCETMWQGYQAVDQLVERCKELRKPITEGMKKWGVDVTGVAKGGEIDLVNLDGVTRSPSLRDSGIGTPMTVDSDEEVRRSGKPKPALLSQPQLMSNDINLKDYQVIGMNWLSLLFEKGLSCILADDMGLGKTCQVIAFLANLYEQEIPGPHLIVVPGSTLENWLREFEMFCPGLPVTSYYGNQPDRLEYQEQIITNSPYVIVTTYTIAAQKDDRRFFAKRNVNCAIFDEGHELKNCKSNRHTELMRINAQFRLLLTGTPLQNNLIELMSLLNFIMPDVFKEYQEDLEVIFKHKAKTSEENHDALLSAQRIDRARSMMAPFILRRKKDQVLQNLPKKATRVEYCELSPSQKDIYQEHIEKAKRVIAARERAKETREFVKDSSNILSALRKACCHPLLFRRHYDSTSLRKIVKAYLRNPAESHRNFDLCLEDMEYSTDHNIHRYCLDPNNAPYMSQFALGPESFLDSGKVTTLLSLLRTYKANGDRALIFSQFVMVLDILEEVLSHASITFFRIDGATRIDERQPLIDAFYADESVTAFMLSTKAGGAGINLAAANKVIIFDCSFNPQDDIQAENRAHRVGQTRDVEVVRLVTKGTIEEQIHALGESKVLLDARVAGDEAGGRKKANEGERMVREALEREVMIEEKEVRPEQKVEEQEVKVEPESSKYEKGNDNAEDSQATQ